MNSRHDFSPPCLQLHSRRTNRSEGNSGKTKTSGIPRKLSVRVSHVGFALFLVVFCCCRGMLEFRETAHLLAFLAVISYAPGKYWSFPIIRKRATLLVQSFQYRFTFHNESLNYYLELVTFGAYHEIEFSTLSHFSA